MAVGSGDRWAASDAYEAFMGRWSRPAARMFLEWLGSRRLAHWLDIGCGTGALTSMICELCEPASIVGCDPSETFVEDARNCSARDLDEGHRFPICQPGALAALFLALGHHPAAQGNFFLL